MYPLLIFVACSAIIAFVVWRTRPEPGPWDISPAPEPGPVDADRSVAVARDELGEWHRDHEATLADWIERHEAVVARLRSIEDPAALSTDHLAELDEAMRRAIESHPAPVMGAELSAMQAAAGASLHAFRRGDSDTARRQHITYLSYRNRWIDRLWQFPTDPGRVRRLRRHLPPSPDELAPATDPSEPSASDPSTPEPD